MLDNEQPIPRPILELDLGSLTREELYALVWSQPMRTVARSMGISDVALAKQCRKSNVPVPPRGWWAKKEAGKPVEVQTLPPLPFAMGDFFPALDKQTGAGEKPDGSGEASAPPVFRDMAVVSQELRAAVKAINISATLSTPHPIVARLLKQDTERQARQTQSGYISDYYGPKFTKPLQQRRLRILSSILVELERLGCKVSGSTHAGEKFSIKVGRHWTYILFGLEGGPMSAPFYRDRRRSSVPEGERLRFDLTNSNPEYEPPKRTWRDGDKKLEHQASEIVCGILLSVEEDARKWALWKHKFDIEEKERRVREAKLAAEKAEADRIAWEKAAEEARLKLLVDGADALERAARIRRYVAAVRTESAVLPEPVSANALKTWMDWALAQADRIDPVLSGRFLADVDASAAMDEDA